MRCDRTYPCGACVKAEVECTFPGPKRARRTLNRPPIAELLARLRNLEEEVSQLRSTRSSSRDSDINPTPDVNDPSNLAKKTELLVLKEGKSRYVGDEASVALGEKVRDE